MHSPDFTRENIAKLAELFPNCVTESKAEDGTLKRAIDFDQLRQELTTSIVEGPQERYHLNWPGKREALLTANAPIAKTLRPCREESVDFDTTKNLFIEGDNLDALKLLQETYLNKVKMIYIDPPYNTGNDFIYEDDFAEDTEAYFERSNQKDDNGNRLVANTEANGRFHSDWLSMLYSRLKLARNLLRDDGAIFISINDNEQANLKRLCDEVFGEENFVVQIIWKSRQIVDSRNKNNSSNDHEQIAIFCKNRDSFSLKGKPIQKEKYTNPDNDSRGAWMSNTILGLANSSQRPNLHYQIIDPDTGIAFNCPADSGWRYSRETMQKKVSEKRIIFPALPAGRPREKKFLSELSSNHTGFSSVLPTDIGFTLNGSREVRELFGDKYFDFPKPVSLIKSLIEQGSLPDCIILDFFSGSSTTAHAVLQLNAEDGGKRKFIMVQLPESSDQKSEAFKAGYKTIAEIGKERIRRAGKKIKDELGRKKDEKNQELALGDSNSFFNLDPSSLDIGFRVLKIDSSNMKDVYYAPDAVKQGDLLEQVDNIREDRKSEDLLFQVLLDWGVDLTLSITQETISGKKVFFVDGNALAACFETGINEEFVKALAARHPLRAVFRDTSFNNDSVKINIEQIFKLISPATEVKTL